jgi:hypothetical protein
MTLLVAAATDGQVFQQALRKFCAGEPDPLTLSILDAE